MLLNDIYRRYLVRNGSEPHYMVAGRLAVFLILGLALICSLPGEFSFRRGDLYGRPERVGDVGELGSMVVVAFQWMGPGRGLIGGGLVYIAIFLISPLTMPWWTRMTIGMTIATVLWMVATLITAPERNKLLLAFYRRARPFGSWGPIHRLAGEAPDSRWGRIAEGMLLAIAGAAAQ